MEDRKSAIFIPDNRLADIRSLYSNQEPGGIFIFEAVRLGLLKPGMTIANKLAATRAAINNPGSVYNAQQGRGTH